MAHLFKRGSVYYAQFWHGGRRQRTTLETTKRQVAQHRLRALLSRLERGEDALPTRTPCADILQRFADHLHAHHRARPLRTDLYRLRECFGSACPALQRKEECSGDEPPRRKRSPRRGGRNRSPMRRPPRLPPMNVKHLEDVTTGMVSGFIADKVRLHGIGPKTANEYREILQRLFNFAIKVEGIRMPGDPRHNPVVDVKRYRVPSPKIRFLSLSQIDEHLAVLEPWPAIQTMVAVYIYAGLRREELLWLTHEDVDLARQVIYVRAKSVTGEAWQPKTGANRRVPVSTSLLPFLERHESDHAIWVFPSPKGFRWDPDNFGHKLAKINRSRGLEWGCLDYRHTFGSHLAMKGESLYKISQLMGNSPEICRRHYAVLMPESLVDSVEFRDRADPPSAPRLRVVH